MKRTRGRWKNWALRGGEGGGARRVLGRMGKNIGPRSRGAMGEGVQKKTTDIKRTTSLLEKSQSLTPLVGEFAISSERQAKQRKGVLLNVRSRQETSRTRREAEDLRNIRCFSEVVLGQRNLSRRGGGETYGKNRSRSRGDPHYQPSGTLPYKNSDDLITRPWRIAPILGSKEWGVTTTLGLERSKALRAHRKYTNS